MKRLIKSIFLIGVLVIFLIISTDKIPLIQEFFNHSVDYVSYQWDLLPFSSMRSKAIEIPEDEPFRVAGINIGDNREQVDFIHSAQSSYLNEYHVHWTAYHQDYHNFFLVMYAEDNTVSGLFTNQAIFSLPFGIEKGSTQSDVHNLYGEPLEYIEKGRTRYLFNEDEEYDIYLLNDQYVTIFYDEFQDNQVTAVQIINYSSEMNFDALYSEPSDELRQGFEHQLFDLVNSTRYEMGLNTLFWSDYLADVARNHSKDMAESQYFDHINPQGQTPFDRLDQAGIFYTMAAENLAFGQRSSIFAHQGLLNSEGHRENILLEGLEELGVGVSFDQEHQTFFTEKFIRSNW